jgi:molybdate transport system substrate-binding protein
MRRPRILGFVVLSVLIFSLVLGIRSLTAPATSSPSGAPLLVSAAASLTDALGELVPLYAQSSPTATVRYNFGSSGALQQQIVNGAPADVFISAAKKQMDALQQKKLILADTRRNFLTNQLVLVVPIDSTEISNLKSLSNPQIQQIAIGNPDSVPAGQYAQEALTKSGLGDQLKSKYVLANTVRQVLQFVEAGNADAGLVYLTDAKYSNKVKIVQQIPADLHAPIVYPIAVLKDSRNQTEAQRFVQFLSSNEAKLIFEKYGFTAT